MQTTGTTDQGTRYPVVSGGSGFVAFLFCLLMAWIEKLFHRAMEEEVEP